MWEGAAKKTAKLLRWDAESRRNNGKTNPQPVLRLDPQPSLSGGNSLHPSPACHPPRLRGARINRGILLLPGFFSSFFYLPPTLLPLPFLLHSLYLVIASPFSSLPSLPHPLPSLAFLSLPHVDKEPNNKWCPLYILNFFHTFFFLPFIINFLKPLSFHL